MYPSYHHTPSYHHIPSYHHAPSYTTNIHHHTSSNTIPYHNILLYNIIRHHILSYTIKYNHFIIKVYNVLYHHISYLKHGLEKEIVRSSLQMVIMLQIFVEWMWRLPLYVMMNGSDVVISPYPRTIMTAYNLIQGSSEQLCLLV